MRHYDSCYEYELGSNEDWAIQRDQALAAWAEAQNTLNRAQRRHHLVSVVYDAISALKNAKKKLEEFDAG